MKKIIFPLLLISLFANVFLGYRHYKNKKTKAEFAKQVDASRRTRMQLFENTPIDSGATVFIGNSITEAFPVDMLPPGSITRGISGAVIFDIKKIAVIVAKNKPGKLYIMGGVNDLKNGIGLESAFAEMTSLIDSVRNISPDTKIIIQSVLPTSGKYAHLNKNIDQFNIKLKSISGVSYIDLNSPMKPGIEKLQYDGLHLNYEGYKIWADAIQ